MINIALINHNDSFTFNVVEVLRKIGLSKLTVINYGDLNLIELQKFDKIILSPGPCLPQDYPKTFEIIKTFYKTKHILGICLGHQAICSFFGAELYNINDVVHGVDKEIIINNSLLFKGIPKKTTVGLYHSWAISNTNFTDDFTVLARTNDEMIMSVKHKKYNVFGIQFHPESFLTIHGEQMLENFIKL